MGAPVTVVATLPYRHNIFIDVQRRKTYKAMDDLAWIVDGIREQGIGFPKTIVYAPGTISTMSNLLMDIKMALGKGLFHSNINYAYYICKNHGHYYFFHDLIIFTQNINDVCVKESKSQLLILESLYAKINVFQTLFLSSVLNTLHAFHNRIFNSGTDAE